MSAFHVSAVIPAAGFSRRFSANEKKQFARLAGRPLVAWCLEAMERSDLVTSVVVVVPPDDVEGSRELLGSFGFEKIAAVTAGGRQRWISVRRGVEAAPENADVVLVHDAARPFVDRAAIRRVIEGCALSGACLCAVPVTDTLKEADERGEFVSGTVPRGRFWRAQTPQAFSRDVLLKIYSSANLDGSGATDEAALAEAAGVRVRIVPGSELNLKITTPDDFAMAELVARNVGRFRD